MIFKGIQAAYISGNYNLSYAKQTVRKWKIMYFYDQHLGE